MKKEADKPSQTRLSVRLTPRASSNAVTRCTDGILYLRVSAAPVEGAANAACCAYVAELLVLRPSQVTVSQGHKNRSKVLTITGLSEETVWERLRLRSPD